MNLNRHTEITRKEYEGGGIFMPRTSIYSFRVGARLKIPLPLLRKYGELGAKICPKRKYYQISINLKKIEERDELINSQ